MPAGSFNSTILRVRLTSIGLKYVQEYYFNQSLPDISPLPDRYGYYAFKLPEFVSIFGPVASDNQWASFFVDDTVKFVTVGLTNG